MNPTKFLKQFGANAKHGAAIATLEFISTTSFSGIAPASMIFKDSQNNLYIAGISPQQEVTFSYPSTPKVSSARANLCGAVVVRGSGGVAITGTIKIDNVSIDSSTLLTQLLPPCTNGSFADSEPLTSKPPMDILFRNKSKYFWKLLSLTLRALIEAFQLSMILIGSSEPRIF